MALQTQTVLTSDGIKIWFTIYPCGGRTDAAVVICPGFFQSQETPTFRRMSQVLARGHDVLCMDFRGHGHSGGLCAFSAKEPWDLEAVLQWAAPRYSRIGVLGFSLGAATAIVTAARHQRLVHSLVAVSAPVAFEEIELKWWTPEAIRRGIEGLEPGAGCRPGSLFLEKPRPIDYVGSLAPIPILFIHGTKDVIVDVRHSRRLYEAASEPKRLELVSGGSHAQALFRDDPDGFCSLIEGWLAETLLPQSTV